MSIDDFENKPEAAGQERETRPQRHIQAEDALIPHPSASTTSHNGRDLRSSTSPEHRLATGQRGPPQREVGPLPLQPPDQVLPRPRLRRRLLSAAVQEEGVARHRRRGLRCRTGVRGVQLQPQAGRARDQEAGISWV